MSKRVLAAALAALMLSGCATVGKKKLDSASLSSQDLQTEIQTRDTRIEELEAELLALRSGSGGTKATAPKSGVIRVAGVSVTDVQKALKRAGLNPGPIDGKLGSKTKEAIKEFQRRKKMNDDGIVGAKTWALLQ